jgi:glycosyltransferase involved in cell wall biosynthesis
VCDETNIKYCEVTQIVIWLSIIIPIYNGEKYIERAIKSILNQDAAEIEIIIIDDGSKDNSYSVCEQFAKKCKQIKLIHSENKGVSHARNIGINEAKGEWIAFLDADDYLLESAIETMMKSVSMKDDLVIFNYRKETEEIQYNKLNKKVLERKDALNILLDFAKYREYLTYSMQLKNSVFTSCWGKLYRKSIIDDYSITFQESLTLSEDMCFNLSYISSIESVTIIDSVVYHYSINPESVTHSFSGKKFYGRQNLIAYLIKKKDLPDDCELAKQKYIILTLLQLAEKIAITRDTEIKEKYLLLLKQICAYKFAWNKIDRCFSIGKKQNFYLQTQYWMLRHKMHKLILVMGYIYARGREQK